MSKIQKELHEEKRRIVDEIVERICKAVDPEKIVLFGSFAQGKITRDSDIDILVIVKFFREKRSDLRLKIRKELRDIPIPKDILVVSEEDVESWGDVPGSFLSYLLRDGKVIYEKRKSSFEKREKFTYEKDKL